MPRTSSDRTTRRIASAGSPYSSRPSEEQKRPSAEQTRQKKQKQTKPTTSPEKRYGLRSMISGLIFGAPKDDQQTDEAEGSDEEGEADGADNNNDKVDRQDDEVQVISSDGGEDEGQEDGRLTAAQKGKGRAGLQRQESDRSRRSAADERPYANGGGFLRSSATFGDMRSIQRDVFQSTPANGKGEPDDDGDETDDGAGEPSPSEVNSTLANFFANKGSASLTAEERRRIGELLKAGSIGSSHMESVPTALTPSFSFAVPSPRSDANASMSILSPNFKRSSTRTGNLSSLAQGSPAPAPFGFRSGLTGSQSLSSLSALAAGPAVSSRLPASANPRSAVSRRSAARPLYLGAGYSSQAIARRKRAAQSASTLYSNLDSYRSSVAAQQQPEVGTPGKRRRVGEEAENSTVHTVGISSPAARPAEQASTTLQSPTPAPQTRPPPPQPAQAAQPVLFNSAPHLKAKFGVGTPVRPSPLRQAEVAATPSPPNTPASAQKPSPAAPVVAAPRTTSRTADLMKNIIGLTDAPKEKPAPKDVFTEEPEEKEEEAPATPEPKQLRRSNRVPRESLIKTTTKASAAEIMERTMPPELRNASTPGRQTRPKPPPVPGSAKKARPATPRRNKPKSPESEKEPESVQEKPQERQQQEEEKEHEELPRKRATTKEAKEAKEPKQSQAAPAKPALPAFGFGPAPTAPNEEGVSRKADSIVVESEKADKAVAVPSANGTTTFSGFSFKKPEAAPPASKPSETTSAGSATGMNGTKAASASTLGSQSAPLNPASPNAAPASGKKADAKSIALAKHTYELPTFTLFDADYGFGAGEAEEDEKIRAFKGTVLAMPKSELRTFVL